MIQTLDEALAYLRDTNAQGRPSLSDPRYFLACHMVVDNREALRRRTYFRMPKGWRDDQAWAYIASATTPFCPCGVDRVCEPLQPKMYVASQAEPVTLHEGDEIFLRPVGAPTRAAYCLLSPHTVVNVPALGFRTDPLSVQGILAALIFTESVPISELSATIDRTGVPMPLAVEIENVGPVPVAAISAANTAEVCVTLVLDAEVEAVSSSSQDRHVH